jgi:hypothetical protein
LKGQAREILSCFPNSISLNTSKLLAALKAKFGQRVQEDVARGRLSELKQSRSQTLRQLGFEVEKLITQAFGDVDERTRDVLSVDSFLNAIYDNDVKLQVRLRQPSGLSVAISTAESVENAVRQVRNSVNKKAYFVNEVQTECNKPNSVDCETFSERENGSGQFNKVNQFQTDYSRKYSEPHNQPASRNSFQRGNGSYGRNLMHRVNQGNAKELGPRDQFQQL